MASKIASLASEKLCFASQQSSLNGCNHSPRVQAHKAPQGAALLLFAQVQQQITCQRTDLETTDARLFDRSVRICTHTTTPAAEAAHAATSGTAALPLREPIPFRPAHERNNVAAASRFHKCERATTPVREPIPFWWIGRGNKYKRPAVPVPLRPAREQRLARRHRAQGAARRRGPAFTCSTTV